MLPLAEAVSGWSTLAAIRSALIVTLPLMFLGSLAELLISFPLDAYKEFMFRQFGPEWRMFGQILKDATFSVMSLIMVFSIGHHLTDQFNHDNPVLRANPVIAGLVAFTAFFCLLQQDGDALNRRWLGVAGLFVAILVGVFATRLFLYFFSIKRLHLHLPGGTPDIAIPQTFNAFIPGMLTVLVFAALGAAMQTFVGMSLHEALYQIIRMPFDAIGEGLGRGMLYILSLHVLWFAGIHGANVLDPITHDIYGAAMLANEVAAAAGEPLPHIMTKTFMDTFVFMGGAGTGISLAGALILFGKTQAEGVAHRLVHGGGVGDAVLHDGDGLTPQGVLHAVGDEAGHVLFAQHGLLAHGAEHLHHRLGHLVAGGVGLDHLHQGDQVAGVPEVSAYKALTVLQLGGDLAGAHDRGVGAEDGGA